MEVSPFAIRNCESSLIKQVKIPTRIVDIAIKVGIMVLEPASLVRIA